jgi:hypothetical protein
MLTRCAFVSTTTAAALGVAADRSTESRRKFLGMVDKLGSAAVEQVAGKVAANAVLDDTRA